MWTQNFRLSQDDQLVDTDKLSLNMYVTDIGLPAAHQHASAGFRITHDEQLRVLKEIFPQVAIRVSVSDAQLIGSKAESERVRTNLDAYKKVAHQTVHHVHRSLSERRRPSFLTKMAIIDASLMRVLDHPTVEFWLSRLFHRDENTSKHCSHVAIYSMLIGMQCGLPSQSVDTLGVAGILHDLGKMFVEQDVLQNPQPLTDIEFDQVKSHSHWGYSLLCQDTRLPKDVVTAVLQHHERIDGCGYPAQLRGNDIHVYAKIIAVADAFDAMTSQRPYNKIKTIEEAMTTITENAGTQFDAEVVKKFKEALVAA